MSRAAWVVYLAVAGTGGIAIGSTIESFPLAVVLSFFWGLMGLTIISGVDESIRN